MEDIVTSILDELRNTPQHTRKAQHTQFKIWRDAMHIAMETDTKHSEEILKHILDYDILVSLEAKIGNLILHRLISSEKEVDDKKLCLIEMLLKSGKIDVNARDEKGKIALHCVEEEKLASLLIGYGADVNTRDNKGTTPLMKASWKISRKTPLVLQTMLRVAGTFLDASNSKGRTALIKAVMMNYSDVVGMLLDAGASSNLSDHLGFTALHHAIRGGCGDHVEFPRNSEELKKRLEIAILFEAEKPQEGSDWYRRNREWNAERMKIVEMLLQRSDIDVNSLSFEKLSPLDMAEGCIPQLPSSIVNALKEKGAVLNVFRETESQSTGEFHLDVRCRLTLKLIIEQVIWSKNKKDADFLKERLLTLIRTHKEKIVAGKDQKGRTALHLTAISFYMFLPFYGDCRCDVANTIVKELISLGCSVNERDIFGRTPLHYSNELLKHIFILYRADVSIKDKDGKSANVQTTEWNDSDKVYSTVKRLCDQSDKTYSLRLVNNRHLEIYIPSVDSQVRTSDDSNGDSALEFWRKEVNLKAVPRLLWEEGKYAFRHSLVDQVTKEVIDLMNAIAKEIERLDQRFAIEPILVGGSHEGTKIGKPDEFDFCFVLTKISEICEVSLSPELPTGFVRLKRKSTTVDETSDFDSFFGKDEILNTEMLNWQFATILSNARVNIESRQSFEWNMVISFRDIFKNLEKVLNIKIIKPLNFFDVDNISIDIVPCIHIDGWWPDEAVSNVSYEMKTLGCNLVFDSPRELYPWVPYSESCARISFARAESDMIRQSCDNAREAYMIAKLMVEKFGRAFKYTLKNCLLYCIDALAPSSDKAFNLGLSLEELESKFHEMDRYLWLKCLLKCRLEFVTQDFCPCYFLPDFSCPNGKTNLKKSFLDCFTDGDSLVWITDGDSSFPRFCKRAYAFYRCTLNDTSAESCCQLPAPDLLWERFDRNQLNASLCEIAYRQ